jgi:hypothetical protein
MPHIWTDEEKAAIKLLDDSGVGARDIGAGYGVNGNSIRKLLNRMAAAARGAPAEPAVPPAPVPPATPAPAAPRYSPSGRVPRTLTERLRDAHNEFDTKTDDELRASRPKWA